MSAKRYIVRLSEEERARLKALLRQNRLAAQKRTRAQVLLKVDEGEEGPAWTDAQAAAAFDVHEETVRAIRCRLVDRGLDAANKAVEETVRASSPSGDKRIGVVWHTQGSGKSISMVFYTAKLILRPEMQNPTVVVITDRNDLDGQLFNQFCAAKGLIPTPVQAENRDHLKQLLQVASGGVVFSTIQKFGVPKGERFPRLSDRRNIVVITDEAHRSQYEFIDGFARNLRDGLPNASFIGFTGTPIECDDRSTPAVFGDYIDTYTVSQAVEDNATVPIYYEARLAKIALTEDKKPEVDQDFEEVTEGEEEATKSRLKTKWAKLEALVGTGERLALIAQDIVDHYERRIEILDGKAMIVTMSRRIAVDLYREIVTLRPEWDGDTDEVGGIKVVMTGSASDPPAFQQHIRNKPRLKDIEKRFSSCEGQPDENTDDGDSRSTEDLGAFAVCVLPLCYPVAHSNRAYFRLPL